MSHDNLDEEKIIPNHEYDGIHELDNPLPGWWLMTFYGTVIFAIFYFAYYSLGSGPTLVQELNQQLAQQEANKPSTPVAAWPDEAKLASVAKDPQQLKAGEAVFTSKCLACHGAKGEGLIGPNLTDNFWIHGKGALPNIAKVIYDGVNEKGMPPWGPILKDDEMYAVTGYVHSLKGTNPPNPKAPQGEEVKE